MGREKNAENIPFLRSTQPKSTERVPVVELSGSECFKDKEKAFSTHQDFLRACAVDAMFKHIGDASVKADTIAREVGVSTRYLSDLFKKTGKTVMNRFLELRLERASTELRDEAFNEFSIEEIAKKNGFVSPAHFARVFKKFYGKTPREWRTAI